MANVASFRQFDKVWRHHNRDLCASAAYAYVPNSALVAQRLRMGTRKSVAARLRAARHRSPVTPAGEDKVIV